MTDLSIILALTLVTQVTEPAQVITAQQRPNDLERSTVSTAADLPQREFAFDGKVIDLLESSPQSEKLLSELRREIETILASYDIRDRATRRELHRTLRNIALVQRDEAEARNQIDILRTLQDKEADQLLSGKLFGAYLSALNAGPVGSPAFSEAFRAQYADALAEMPWSIVGVSLKEELAAAERISIVMTEAWLDRQVQPSVDAGQKISTADLSTIAAMRLEKEILIGLQPDNVAVLRAHIAENDVVKSDIWADRLAPDLPIDRLSPVTIAVWDSGVDVNLFSGRLWSDKKQVQQAANVIGDRIDEKHGLAFDAQGRPDKGLMLSPPPDLASRLDQARTAFKGFSDQSSGITSPEAEALLELTSRLTPEEGDKLLSDISFFGEFAHGTHVAGIAMEGNPAARLLTIRASTDWRAVPERPTRERAARIAKMHQDIVDYLKAGGARVVNISWGFDVSVYERQLEIHGVPLEARRTEAREMFDIESRALRDAIASAPEILFVVAAGNGNDDASFAASIPQSIDAENVLTVAAVDQAGEPALFTALGAAVDVAASGYQIESFVPGGERQQWSGTSMAAPQVVNLAGRLLAIAPDLSVKQLRACIVNSTSAGANSLRLIHPRNALQALTANDLQERAGTEATSTCSF